MIKQPRWQGQHARRYIFPQQHFEPPCDAFRDRHFFQEANCHFALAPTRSAAQLAVAPKMASAKHGGSECSGRGGEESCHQQCCHLGAGCGPGNGRRCDLGRLLVDRFHGVGLGIGASLGGVVVLVDVGGRRLQGIHHVVAGDVELDAGREIEQDLLQVQLNPAVPNLETLDDPLLEAVRERTRRRTVACEHAQAQQPHTIGRCGAVREGRDAAADCRRGRRELEPADLDVVARLDGRFRHIVHQLGHHQASAAAIGTDVDEAAGPGEGDALQHIYVGVVDLQGGIQATV
mmetsp:Transcript_26972/g.77238  ORF Transcript_26972/g.77238 Transcript_26972/m.77238 type:complete len:290 (+) Transcript_26972:256-1125(+)